MKTNRAHHWTLTRRLADRWFQYAIPGKHHSMDSTLLAVIRAVNFR